MDFDIIEIDKKLVSSELKDVHFICDLSVCKGACCVEGDNGAPVAEDELEIMDNLLEKVRPYLTAEGIAAIEKDGAYIYDEEEQEYGTTLIDGKACAFINYEKGIAVCGIEKAYNDGVVDFKKPISCHLYPIRVTKLGEYDALNYEKWDICSAACVKGKQEKLPVYKFLKEPLVRKYGVAFYDALDDALNREKEV